MPLSETIRSIAESICLYRKYPGKENNRLRGLLREAYSYLETHYPPITARNRDHNRILRGAKKEKKAAIAEDIQRALGMEVDINPEQFADRYLPRQK